jgi:hypothetical protein
MNTWDIHFMSSLMLEEKFPGMTKAQVLKYLLENNLLDTRLDDYTSFLSNYSSDKHFASYLFATNNIRELDYYYRSLSLDQLVYESNNYGLCHRKNLESLFNSLVKQHAKSLVDIIKILEIAKRNVPNWNISNDDLIIYGCPETWDLVKITRYDTDDFLWFILVTSSKELVKYFMSKGIRPEGLLLATNNVYAINDDRLPILGFLLSYVRDSSIISKLTNKQIIAYINS